MHNRCLNKPVRHHGVLRSSPPNHRRAPRVCQMRDTTLSYQQNDPQDIKFEPKSKVFLLPCIEQCRIGWSELQPLNGSLHRQKQRCRRRGYKSTTA